MPDDNDFEYDVAFSFTTLDEGIATQLNDLLADRVKTFLYSERQREIAGTDGQESFSKVFGKTARVVVILFRPEWGQTSWTRVEMDAIKNRSLEDGWDFTTFVPTVDEPEMPPWLPKTRLYVGLQRFGIESAAGVIEARVAERGGQPHVESVTDRAARFVRASDLKQKQKQFQNSELGVAAATKAYEAFSVALEDACGAIAESGVTLEVKRSQEYRVVRGLNLVNMICGFRAPYANALENANLSVKLYKGLPSLPGWYPSLEEAHQLSSLRYGYELVRPDYHSWVGIDEKRREFTPQQLAEHVIRTYMDIAERTKED